MQTSPNTILRFLDNHFELISQIKEISKSESILKSELIGELCFAHQVEKEKLLKYRILKQLKNGDFQFNIQYDDFISFLLDDFSLDLPESIKKNQEKIKNISAQLQSSTNRNHTQELIIGLIKVINQFINDIENNTVRLLKETQKLKSNKEGLSYPTKVEKATFLVDFYITPVNQLFNNHSESVINILRQVRLWVNRKITSTTDNNLEIQFRNLYEHINSIQDELMKYSKVLTKELLPLLDRIRTESELLTGFLEFLKTPKSYQAPYFVKSTRHNTIATNFKENTLFFIDIVQQDTVPSIIEEQEKIDTWFFDRDKYINRIIYNLPIQNFSQYCYEMIQDIESNITLEQFYTVQSLLLENRFEAVFTEHKIDLQIENFIISTPIIQLYAIS